jgi:hypothetical protein
MASAPARPGAVDLQAHLGSQLRFIMGNVARLDRSASKRGLTADESRELGFCERMLGAVRPFKNADTDLQNAKLAFHEGKGHFKPAKRVGFNQQRLLVRNLQLNIRRNGVRQCRRVINLGQLNSCLCGHFLVQFRIILELLGH